MGKNVLGTWRSNWFDRDGSHPEYIVVPSGYLLEMPCTLSFAQAACSLEFLMAATVVEIAGVENSEVVLVLSMFYFLFCKTTIKYAN